MADNPALTALDKYGGIDCLFVTDDGQLQGIAHRVNWRPEPIENFTVTVSRPSGAPTEFDRRLQTFRRSDEHFVVPHYTVQAFVERRRTGRLLLCMMVDTRDLFEFIVANPDYLDPRRNPYDGSTFIGIWTEDLRRAGVRVFEGGTCFDTTILVPGGGAWVPYVIDDPFDPRDETAYSKYRMAEEEEDDEGPWYDEDDDECIEPIGYGDFCPRCGDIHLAC
jgi:hypothetical protein